MHLGLYTTDTFQRTNIRANVFICLSPSFLHFISFLSIFFFLSSFIPSLNFIFVYHSVPLSLALGVELCFSFVSDLLLIRSSQGAVTTSHEGKNAKKQNKTKQEKK